MSQETAALAIVLLAAVVALFWIFNRYLALPLASWLLKRGRIKLAMRIHPRFRRFAGNGRNSPGSDCQSH